MIYSINGNKKEILTNKTYYIVTNTPNGPLAKGYFIKETTACYVVAKNEDKKIEKLYLYMIEQLMDKEEALCKMNEYEKHGPATQSNEDEPGTFCHHCKSPIIYAKSNFCTKCNAYICNDCHACFCKNSYIHGYK